MLARQAPQNVVIILADDHRYDFMGFHEGAFDFLKTASLDRMAQGGAHLANAFVMTSLCSPSLASILSGQYAHRHGVVDNSSTVPGGTRFFPEFFQRNGYSTAFVGKWYMGEVDDDPQPGFDHWISFRGQGVYYDPLLNINGERRQAEGYITDLLTDLTIDWLKERKREEPSFLVLSHKAVHTEFHPTRRHAGPFAEIKIPYPESMANTKRNDRTKPEWVKKQRYGGMAAITCITEKWTLISSTDATPKRCCQSTKA